MIQIIQTQICQRKHIAVDFKKKVTGHLTHYEMLTPESNLLCSYTGFVDTGKMTNVLQKKLFILL